MENISSHQPPGSDNDDNNSTDVNGANDCNTANVDNNTADSTGVLIVNNATAPRTVTINTPYPVPETATHGSTQSYACNGDAKSTTDSFKQLLGHNDNDTTAVDNDSTVFIAHDTNTANNISSHCWHRQPPNQLPFQA